MRIQVVSKYLDLAKEGLVPKVDCPLDQGSLMPNLSEDDTIYLYCLSCEYKKIIGGDFYKKINEDLKKILNGKR